MREARSNFGCAALGGEVYAVGGLNGHRAKRTVERLAYFAARLGASGLGGALVLAPVVALFLALFLAFAVKALAHNLQRLFGRKKRRRRKAD